MSPQTIRAHFDGEQIRLDEPYHLAPDTQLLIVVLPDQSRDGERDDWIYLSKRALENTYSSDEPEYCLAAIQEQNPDYRDG